MNDHPDEDNAGQSSSKQPKIDLAFGLKSKNINISLKINYYQVLGTRMGPKQFGDDPFSFWTGENATKWPALAKLARKYFSAPATSAESERLFSTAGQIITNLRSSLKDENVEKLLFLHHNMKIYNFNYA